MHLHRRRAAWACARAGGLRLYSSQLQSPVNGGVRSGGTGRDHENLATMEDDDASQPTSRREDDAPGGPAAVMNDDDDDDRSVARARAEVSVMQSANDGPRRRAPGPRRPTRRYRERSGRRGGGVRGRRQGGGAGEGSVPRVPGELVSLVIFSPTGPGGGRSTPALARPP
ncbi:hypothetical protein THAOC_31074 [Thalassiosira oceanica]|uniref:Uncharacterized protein n=1 Tax=Thalassiosira oceanica TaxID=159749 RepID=K0RCJ3_THAOC|nr:hypothetical protein THAOC_31074 [Thalassiosira oceanica]|eukprot:EJK49999.1 hypothetical protein THAOC_31074 [Thalassiosira oceanica]